MSLRFEAISELDSGVKWQNFFERHWDSYKEWFYSEGDAARPSYLECHQQLKLHMPELLETYEQLCALAGGSDSAARFLSMYCPPPYLSACSQAVWCGEENFLIRNYDYSPSYLEAALWQTQWHEHKVIAMSECLWGVIDGMNDSGLAVSLTFGGRQVVGKGFGIPIVLRYILEFCENTEQAVKELKRIPTHMAYNVTVLDKGGHFKTVYLSPDRPSIVRQLAATTNHQESVEWLQHAHATASRERELFLFERLADIWETPERFIQYFLQPPLYSYNYAKGFGTLYTTIYRPESNQVQVLWPNHAWQQSFHKFTEQRYTFHYGPF